MKEAAILARMERDMELWLRVTSAIPRALENAKTDSAGIKAQSFDGVVASGHGPSDPTGRAALQKNRIDDEVQQIQHALNVWHDLIEPTLTAVAFLTRAPENHKAARQREEERKTLADENRFRCWSCARVEKAPGVPWDCGGTGKRCRKTDVGGLLDEPRVICEWTQRHVKRFGSLPSIEDVQYYRDNGTGMPRRVG